jgi:predicted esterase
VKKNTPHCPLAILLLIHLLVLGFLPQHARTQPSIVAKFVARSLTYNGTTLPYRLFVPESYTPSKRYPVVLALHGSGERGSDNLVQISGWRLATSWADPINQVKYPCFVVAPQCPDGKSWSGPELATANAILDSLAAEFSIDANRMYVTGLSMGGFGTWGLITSFPDRFAAAVPMSAGWGSDGAPAILRVPIWNFHGAQDEVVPVSWSREIIGALESLGRTVVYTHCHNGDCAGVPDSVTAANVRSHADLFYTEYQNGHHVIWNESYDFPSLFPWVFDKYRMTAGAVTLTGLKSYRVVRGSESISWSAANPTDSVEIQFSPDAGRTWRMVVSSLPNTGTFVWNTQNVGDCAFGLLKIFLKNSDGHIYSRDQSNYFAIDNGTNASLYAGLLNRDSFVGTTLLKDTVSLLLLLGGSKGGTLTASLSYSADNGGHFVQFAGFMFQSDTTARARIATIGSLPNSDNAVIRIDVSNGTNSVSDRTPRFVKRTPRSSGPMASHIAGSGGATVVVNIVDPTQLTGHSYRVTFDDTSSAIKTYDVKNLTTGLTVVHGATELDGTAEGPQFEGLRLLIKDFPEPVVDVAKTRWRIGASTLLRGSAYLPTLPVGTGEVKGIAYPADYTITVYDHVVDTSSAAFPDYPAIQTNFRVQHSGGHGKGQFIFLDSDNDQKLSNFDGILILEADSMGKPFLTWALSFTGAQGQYTLPQPGDEFDLKTLNPLTSKDVFVFLITSVQKEGVPALFGLEQNFPNPFNPTTKIKYSVPSGRDLVRGADGQIPTFSRVILKVFDLLGREVRTLVNEGKAPGNYEVTFDGKGLASGVYFYRLEAGGRVETKKLLMLR